MANVSRKAVAAALLATIAPAGGPFFQRGRRLTKPDNTAAPGKPALFLIKPSEKIIRDGAGEPPRRVMRFWAVIFTDVGTDANAVPADIIDDLVDSIDLALAPSVADQLGNGGRCSLGGTPGVYEAAVEGEPQFAPGDKQGRGETLVPIVVTLNQYP